MSLKFSIHFLRLFVISFLFMASLAKAQHPNINGKNISQWEYMARNLENIKEIERLEPKTSACSQALETVYADIAESNGMEQNAASGKKILKEHFRNLSNNLTFIGSPVTDWSTKYQKLGPNPHAVDTVVKGSGVSMGTYFQLSALKKAKSNVVEKLSSRYETPETTFKDFVAFGCRNGDNTRVSNRISFKYREKLNAYEKELEQKGISPQEVSSKVMEKDRLWYGEYTRKYSQYLNSSCKGTDGLCCDNDRYYKWSKYMKSYERKREELYELRKGIDLSDTNWKSRRDWLDGVSYELKAEMMHEFNQIFGDYPSDLQLSQSSYTKATKHFSDSWDRMEKMVPFTLYSKYEKLFSSDNFEGSMKQLLSGCLSDNILNSNGKEIKVHSELQNILYSGNKACAAQINALTSLLQEKGFAYPSGNINDSQFATLDTDYLMRTFNSPESLTHFWQLPEAEYVTSHRSWYNKHSQKTRKLIEANSSQQDKLRTIIDDKRFKRAKYCVNHVPEPPVKVAEPAMEPVVVAQDDVSNNDRVETKESTESWGDYIKSWSPSSWGSWGQAQ
jgi:hypothetical protein